MGYLVKESLTAEPRQYDLESIRSDLERKQLAGNALVREERQDFWYSVAELVGESPAKEFEFACPRCQATIQAREIDVGLEIPCPECLEMVLAPDILPQKDPSVDQPLLRRGNRLLLIGAAIFFTTELLSFNGHGIFLVSRVLELVGACMMINGYGKRKLYYLKHPYTAPLTLSPPASNHDGSLG